MSFVNLITAVCLSSACGSVNLKPVLYLCFHLNHFLSKDGSLPGRGPFNLIHGYQHFTGTCHLHLQVSSSYLSRVISMQQREWGGLGQDYQQSNGSCFKQKWKEVGEKAQKQKDQDYLVFGLCPLYGILKNSEEHNVKETGSVSIPR
jgi:hypothetical protein